MTPAQRVAGLYLQSAADPATYTNLFLTPKSQNNLLPIENMEREPQTVLGPGSATPNSPQDPELDWPRTGEGSLSRVADFRELPQPYSSIPNTQSEREDPYSGLHARTIPVPGDQYNIDNETKFDYETPTRKKVAARYLASLEKQADPYKKRIPWKKQHRQDPQTRVEDKQYYKRHKNQIKLRLKRWYKKNHKNRQMQTVRDQYEDNPRKFKRQKSASFQAGINFHLMPDQIPCSILEITDDGVLTYQEINTDIEKRIPVGSLLYLADFDTEQDEQNMEAVLDQLPEDAVQKPTPDDIRHIAEIASYDLTGIDLYSLTEDQTEALLDDMVGRDSPVSKTAYEHRHHQHGTAKRHSHAEYMHNRTKSKHQSHLWYQRHKHNSQYQRHQHLRHEHPERFRMRFADVSGTRFTIRQGTMEGIILQVQPDPVVGGAVTFQLYDSSQTLSDNTMPVTAFLHAVVFESDVIIEQVYNWIDQVCGLTAYQDVSPQTVLQVAQLNGIPTGTDSWTQFIQDTIGVTDLNHAGESDLLRLCSHIVFPDDSPWTAKQAADTFTYDIRPPDANLEKPDISMGGGENTPAAGGWWTKQTPDLTHKPQSPDIPVPGPENYPASSGKVIPDSMKYSSMKVATRFLFATFSSRTAAKIGEILKHTDPAIKARAKKIKPRLQRADQKLGLWTFSVPGSDGSYTVKLRAIPDAESGNKVSDLDIQISCDCDFFRWQGPSYHAVAHKYMYKKPEGTAEKPTEKDPNGKNWLCKHSVAALDMAYEHYEVKP